MKVAIDNRTLELPEGVTVTLTIHFPNGQGISVHPESPAPPTTMAAAARRLAETGGQIVPGEADGRRQKPGTGRKACPKCHELCGASLRACPNQFCDHIFVKG